MVLVHLEQVKAVLVLILPMEGCSGYLRKSFQNQRNDVLRVYSSKYLGFSIFPCTGHADKFIFATGQVAVTLFNPEL
ncbi:hypothetical protein BDW72DRAFT_154899 [Aspergillus terricola var. indicus]